MDSKTTNTRARAIRQAEGCTWNEALKKAAAEFRARSGQSRSKIGKKKPETGQSVSALVAARRRLAIFQRP